MSAVHSFLHCSLYTTGKSHLKIVGCDFQIPYKIFAMHALLLQMTRVYIGRTQRLLID